MARNKFDYTHGDTGIKPSSSLNFQQNGRPDAQRFDWMWDQTVKKINDLWDEFSRIDSDDNGTVDEADNAQQLGENGPGHYATASSLSSHEDDPDRHHEVFEPSDYNPETDTHDRYTDSEARAAVSGSSISIDGDAGSVGGQSWSDIQSWVNNNSDVPSADHADNAGDADTLDGQHWSDIQSWVNDTADVSNADHADDADTVGGQNWSDIQSWVNNSADVSDADQADNANTIDGYEIQKNGTDEQGVINFKT